MLLPIFYQERMEQFYNAMAEAILTKNFDALIDGVQWIYPYPELLLFEQSVYCEPPDDSLEVFLGYVVEKGYRILMNFYAPDVILGNVALKIRYRWFAFGRCRNESREERYVTEIWPLRYVLPNLQKMEVKLRYAIPLCPEAETHQMHARISF